MGPTAQRLLRLEEILAHSKFSGVAVDGTTDRVKWHLDSVPLERIRQLTAELDARNGSVSDEIDAVAMRVLLNDYITAVQHLRSVARAAEAQLEAASAPLTDVRRFVWRELKLQEARRQAAEETSSTQSALPTRSQGDGSDV
jgi:hypothetical protein